MEKLLVTMDDSCRIRVVCRVRPLNTKEKANSDFVVKFPSASTVELTVSTCMDCTDGHTSVCSDIQ